MEDFQVLGRALDRQAMYDLGRATVAGYADLREPLINRKIGREDVDGGRHPDGWHQDGAGVAHTTPALIMWANVYPTEVLLPSGLIVSGEPYDVVLIDNITTKHRVPRTYVDAVRRDTDPDRYFIRISVYERPSDEDIASWRMGLREAAA